MSGTTGGVIFSMVWGCGWGCGLGFDAVPLLGTLFSIVLRTLGLGRGLALMAGAHVWATEEGRCPAIKVKIRV